eukprot:TRINITY_DN3324_c0_g2_i2.p1 TRINITY_DN3324_c0_g2~~TRINITY_DN3324_c0_g2_i2.p1  ORF type:complete len:385 (-),score=55.40 TRINITY_DN3324_c0_g2_i2:315-1469(-)
MSLIRNVLDNLMFDQVSLLEIVQRELVQILAIEPTEVTLNGLLRTPEGLSLQPRVTDASLRNDALVITKAKTVSGVLALITSTLYGSDFCEPPLVALSPGSRRRSPAELRGWRNMHALAMHELRLLVEWVVFDTVGGMSRFLDWMLKIPAVTTVQQYWDRHIEEQRQENIRTQMQDSGSWVKKLQEACEVKYSSEDFRDTFSGNLKRELDFRSEHDSRVQKMSTEDLNAQVMLEHLKGVLLPSLMHVDILCDTNVTPGHKVQHWSHAVASAVTMINLQLESVGKDPIGGPQMPGVVLFMAMMNTSDNLWAHVLLGTLFTVFAGDAQQHGLEQRPYTLYPDNDDNAMEQFVLNGASRGIDPLHYWSFLTGSMRVLLSPTAASPEA